MSTPAFPCRDDDPSRPLIEVMIPTLNEESHIEETVVNALQLGPVFVLDSHSTDRTCEIAEAAGATVVKHTFEDYSKQKNWGIDNLPFNGEWLFIIDADERVTPALRDEMIQIARDEKSIDGFFVNRLVIFMGRPIRHGGLYPSWNLRFFRRGTCRYEDRAVHEHMVCQGETAHLKEEMLHIRRETMSEYLRKHVYYADLESNEWMKMRLGQSGGARARVLFPSTLRYRQWLRRHWWPKTPFRPLWRFIYMYFVRLGILDGRAGWHLALLMASYEYMISLLYREKIARQRERPIDGVPAISSSTVLGTGGTDVDEDDREAMEAQPATIGSE